MIETKVRELKNWPIAVPVKDPLDDFFEKLAQTPRDWEVVGSGRIRRLIGDGPNRVCPISAVTGNPEDFDNPLPAARRLGISHSDAYRVFDAAECPGNSYRARLLEACGIEERHDS